MSSYDAFFTLCPLDDAHTTIKPLLHPSVSSAQDLESTLGPRPLERQITPSSLNALRTFGGSYKKYSRGSYRAGPRLLSGKDPKHPHRANILTTLSFLQRAIQGYRYVFTRQGKSGLEFAASKIIGSGAIFLLPTLSNPQKHYVQFNRRSTLLVHSPTVSPPT